MANKNGQQSILGMEEFEIEEEDNTIHDGQPKYNVSYFDASLLPDAPEYQRTAHGSKSFIMYIIYPSFEDMCKGLEILTLGQRKNVVKGSTACTLSSTAISKVTGKSLIKSWQEKLVLTIGDEAGVTEVESTYEMIGDEK